MFKKIRQFLGLLTPAEIETLDKSAEKAERVVDLMKAETSFWEAAMFYERQGELIKAQESRESALYYQAKFLKEVNRIA